MSYAVGTHNQPTDSKDRLVRVGTKYNSAAQSLADGDNTYLAVDSAGRLIVIGAVLESAGPTDGAGNKSFADTNLGGSGANVGSVALYGLAPDNAWDRLKVAQNASVGPGIGALSVAPIGGDISLRASAAAGEANGTSTAVDNLGWVKSLHGVLDVTAVPSGGTPTLDVYVQTQLADATWQDIAHFTQGAGVATKEILAWKGPGATESGTQAEAAAVTVDNYFSNEDAALAATTVRLLPLGDSMRVKWVFAAGGSTGDYTFSVDIAAHS